jgi:hypothetical protein
MGWDKTLEDIKAVPGRVFMPFTCYLPILVGKESSAFLMNLDNILFYAPPSDPGYQILNTQIVRRLSEGYYDVVVTSGPGWTVHSNTIDLYYDKKFYQFEGVAPVAGWKIVPNNWQTYKTKPKGAK